MKIVLLVVVLVLLGNLLILNFFVFQHENNFKDLNAKIISITGDIQRSENEVVSNIEKQPSASSSCDSECVALINAAVDDKVSKIKIPNPAKQTQSVAPKTTQTQEWIIPIGGGVVDNINTWTDIYTAQAQIDTSDYPPIQQAYFEVVMHIPNATGEMSARLYDTSSPYLYAGQVLSTTSGTGQLLSVPFPIQKGVLNYHVQLYTSISQGVLDSSRIRLVTQ